jgi:hypothetical protein
VQLDAATPNAVVRCRRAPSDIEVLWRLARRVSEQFPIFQDPTIRVAEHRRAADAHDGRPLPAGRCPAWPEPGMSGCCVGGLSVSPALGEAMAEWILDGCRRLGPPLSSPPRALRRVAPTKSARAREPTSLPTRYRTGGRSQPPRDSRFTFPRCRHRVRADPAVDQPPLGVGEVASTPVPAALANAVFDATGCDCGPCRSGRSG